MPCECEPGDVLPTTPCERQLLPWALGPRLTLVSQLLPEKEKCGALRQSERTCPPPHAASRTACQHGVAGVQAELVAPNGVDEREDYDQHEDHERQLRPRPWQLRTPLAEGVEAQVVGSPQPRAVNRRLRAGARAPRQPPFGSPAAGALFLGPETNRPE